MPEFTHYVGDLLDMSATWASESWHCLHFLDKKHTDGQCTARFGFAHDDSPVTEPNTLIVCAYNDPNHDGPCAARNQRRMVDAGVPTLLLVASDASPAEEPEEMVNHPNHYGGDSVYETIKVLEAWGLDHDAYLFMAVKYISRAGKKDPTKVIEDLEKAVFYVQRRIDRLKEQQDD